MQIYFIGSLYILYEIWEYRVQMNMIFLEMFNKDIKRFHEYRAQPEWACKLQLNIGKYKIAAV